MMPYKANEARRHRIPRARYKVTNWPEYDGALQRRGSLTVWVIPDPADRLSKADRPPPCAVIAVALINRIPYDALLAQLRQEDGAAMAGVPDGGLWQIAAWAKARGLDPGKPLDGERLLGALAQ